MRYLHSFNSLELEQEFFDVLVIGSGLAGLSAAYYAASAGKNASVCILSKDIEGGKSSNFAQGGIACASGKNDSWQKHVADTLSAGKGLSDEILAEILARHGIERIKELIELGLKFDEKEDGIAFGREAGHSENRILHIKGDSTGSEITKFMKKLCEEKNVYFIEGKMLEILGEKEANGILADVKGEKGIFSSSASILASGGYSGLFEKTTNPFSAGSALNVAHRAGAGLMDLEFQQFHPTTAALGMEIFLVSEAVRGEGAKITDEKGKRILENVQGKELATRDIVSRILFEHGLRGGKAFLDCSNKGPEFWKQRFPGIFNKLKANGITMGDNLIEVMPAAHYSIGGIKANEKTETSLNRLYAVGECSCNGLHGANRLASNSLLECVVFGKIAAENALMKAGKPGKIKIEGKGIESRKEETAGLDIKGLMWKNCGIERIEAGLRNALNEVKGREMHLKSAGRTELLEIAGLAEKIIESALKRGESRGCHFRKDFPEEKEEWKRHSEI